MKHRDIDELNEAVDQLNLLVNCNYNNVLRITMITEDLKCRISLLEKRVDGYVRQQIVISTATLIMQIAILISLFFKH